MIPGELFLNDEAVDCNVDRATKKIKVKNSGDRPIQVGSHTHFFESNRKLEFPRAEAYGFRLNIAAGASIRFEPGDNKEIELVALGGKRIVYGFNGLVQGGLDNERRKTKAIRVAKEQEFKGA